MYFLPNFSKLTFFPQKCFFRITEILSFYNNKKQKFHQSASFFLSLKFSQSFISEFGTFCRAPASVFILLVSVPLNISFPVAGRTEDKKTTAADSSIKKKANNELLPVIRDLRGFWQHRNLKQSRKRVSSLQEIFLIFFNYYYYHFWEFMARLWKDPTVTHKERKKKKKKLLGEDLGAWRMRTMWTIKTFVTKGRYVWKMKMPECIRVLCYLYLSLYFCPRDGSMKTYTL